MKAFLSRFYLLPLVLLCGFYTYMAADFPAHDFANYYFGGKFLAEGRFGDWVYFPYEFNKTIAYEGAKNIFASYAPNTPFLALVFLPFSFLPLAVAKLVFNILGVLLFLFTLRRLVAFYKINPVYVVFIPLLFFVPIKNGLLFGQIYFILFFLIGETWLSYKKNKPAKVALYVSLAIFIKIFPALLVLVFAFRKKFTLLAYTAICCLALLFLSALFSSFETWVFFFDEVLPKASKGEISEAYVRNYQSVLMLLKEVLVYDKTENPHAFLDAPAWFAALVVAFKIKLLAIGYYVSRKVSMPLVTLSYWVLAMILISPYGSTYSLILLLIPFLALAKNSLPEWKKAVGIALIFIICNVPVSWFTTFAFPLSYLRLLALLLFFTLVFSLVYKKIAFKNVAVIVIIPLLLVFFLTKKETTPEVVLTKNTPILIHDYKIEGDQLTYFYWNENGENSVSITYGKHLSVPVILHENQVFHDGRQVTFENSNKRKPLFLDGKTLLYLSDQGRGIGFYTLRKITLPDNE